MQQEVTVEQVAVKSVIVFLQAGQAMTRAPPTSQALSNIMCILGPEILAAPADLCNVHSKNSNRVGGASYCHSY